jgi:hypothetical protein
MRRMIVLALFASLALGTLLSSAAQAAEGWTIGTAENQTTAGTLIPNGTHERISCKKHGGSPLILTGKLLGENVEITAEGVDCLEKAGSTNAATIDNTTSKGHSEGVLTFTGVKVVKPANCSVAGGELTTSQLTDEVIMDTTEGSTVVFDRFFPEVAANGLLTVEFLGALCVLAESSATVKGNACGETVHTNAGGTGYEPNKTGTLTKVQTLLYGSAQQATGGCSLTFGGEPAQLAGAVDYELSGANAGKPFGAD